jgi:outer membrane receptor protein involved in Fe transport
MRRHLLLILSFALCLSSAYASQFGRLTGTVRDDKNQPIQSTSVRLENTRLGTASDLDGQFQIAAIVPGRYTVLISSVGYRSQKIVDVEIVSGRRTHLSVKLEAETLNLSPVTVTFKKPPVNLDETYERVTVLQETIAELPVRRSDNMVQYQPGAVLGPGGDVHVRGGRSGELVYVVDGLQVEDPVAGKRAANIGREGMQEVQFLTGTFDAEYGSSMSGVVNIVSREGGDKYRGSLEWESPMLNESPYRTDNIKGFRTRTVLDNQDPWIPSEGRYSGTLSGPVPFMQPMTFFLHGVHEAETKTEAFGDKWVRRITGKLALPLNGGKLTGSFGFRGRDDQPYNHQWKYNSHRFHRRWERNNRASLTWTDSINPTLFYDLTAGVYHRTSDVKIFKTWDEYVEAGWEAPRGGSGFYNVGQWSDTWSESEATSIVGSGKLNWHPTASQELTAGADLRSEQIKLTDIDLTGIGPNDEQLGRVNRFDESPLELAVWGQDRIELGRWLFNSGLRLDVVDVGSSGWSIPAEAGSTSRSIDPKWQLSPRVGVAFRSGERTSLHAAYGQFFQMPDYKAMFINAAALGNDQSQVFGIVGNPDLNPQRTVAYELGLKHAETELVGFSLTGFYKDIKDLVAEKISATVTGREIVTFRNVDESVAYGVELSVHKLYADYWSLDLNYTLSWAEENDDAKDDPRLPWDRRHSTNAIFAWQTGRDAYPRVFGTPVLQGVSVGLLATYSTGLPYPMSDFATPGMPGDLGTNTTAVFVRVDVRVAKTFWWDELAFTPFVTVDNLLDRQNPIEPAPESNFEHTIAIYGTETRFISDPDPAYWDIPRLVRAGVQLRF